MLSVDAFADKAVAYVGFALVHECECQVASNVSGQDQLGVTPNVPMLIVPAVLTSERVLPQNTARHSSSRTRCGLISSGLPTFRRLPAQRIADLIGWRRDAPGASFVLFMQHHLRPRIACLPPGRLAETTFPRALFARGPAPLDFLHGHLHGGKITSCAATSGVIHDEKKISLRESR